MDINDLPNEIIVDILSKLNVKERISITRVCQRWKSLIINVINKDLYLIRRNFACDPDNQHLSNYLDSFFDVNYPAALKNFNYYNFIVLPWESEERELQMWKFGVWEKCCKKVIKYFPNIRTLCSYEISHEMIEYICENCKKLEFFGANRWMDQIAFDSLRKTFGEKLKLIYGYREVYQNPKRWFRNCSS